MEQSIIAANPNRARRRWPELVLFAALFAEGYFLVHDVPLFRTESSRGSAPTTPPIAQLLTKSNVVHVQAPGDLVWEETRAGQTLHRRESVLTLERSKAEIAFLDGTGLILDESSLVQLEKAPSDDSLGYQRIIIRLVRGSLRKTEPRKTPELSRRIATEVPELEIVIGNASAVIRPDAELTARASPEGGSIQVHAGHVDLRTPNGDVSIRPGEETRVAAQDAQIPPVSKAIPFVLLAPKGGATIDAKEVSRIPFRWKNTVGMTAGRPLELEFGPDPSFASGVRRIRIAATEPPLEQTEIEAEVPSVEKAAMWYWRVRAIGSANGSTNGSKMLASDAQPLWILPSDSAPPPPELHDAEIRDEEPAGGEPAPAHSWFRSLIPSAWAADLPASKSWKIHLKWQDVPGVKAYRLQIAREKGFKNVLLEKEVSGAEYDWDYRLGMENSKGRVFYRVASVSAGGKVGRFSGPKPIQIPEKILARARKESPSQARNEVYDAVDRDAIDGDGAAPESGDSAESSDLHTLAGKGPVQSTSIPVSPQEELAVKTARRELEMFRERERHAQQKPARGDSAGAEASVAQASTAEASVPSRTRVGSRLSAALGYGSLKQDGGTGSLSSVAIESAYLQQRVTASLLLSHFPLEGSASHHEIELAWGQAGFGRPASGRTTLQTDVAAAQWRLNLLRWEKNAVGPWDLGVGAVIDRAYRFVKTGPQSVEPLGAVSLGPAATAVRHYGDGLAPLPAEFGIALALPATGLATDGQAGALASVWGEWKLSDISKTRIGLRLEAQGALRRWDSLTVSEWTVWLAPAIHFGESRPQLSL